MKQAQIRSYNDSLFRNISVDVNNSSVTSYQFEYLHSLIKEFTGSAFDNITEFPYLYLTSGITEFLNFYFSRNEFKSEDDDYRYLKLFETRKVNSDLLYYSYPFSGNGYFQDISVAQSVVLDCAYIFASNLNNNRMLPKNVQCVTFSLSKSHNLSDLRIGWVLSKIRIPQYHIVQYEYKYINSLYVAVFENILRFRPNELYLRNKDNLSKLYSENDCIEPDTNLFGLNNSRRIPYYTLVN